MKAIARVATRRPVTVVLTWIAVLAALSAVSATVSDGFRDSFALPGTDSDDAYALLGERFPSTSGDTDQIVIDAEGAPLSDWRTELDATVASLREAESVGAVVSPLDPAGAPQLSAGGTVGFIAVTYIDDAYNLPLEDIEAVGEIASDLDDVDGLTVGHGGQAASRLSNPEVGIGELLGLAIAGVILVLAFGSGRAATIPLISAVVAVTGAITALSIVTGFAAITTSAPLLAVLLGLGIGIDYALFLVNRHRVGLKAGTPVRESIIGAMTTSGRAVVFAGITVAIALLGMLVPRTSFLTGLALTAAITVAFSVASSITLVPALLALYGDKVLSRKERAALAATFPTAGAARSAAVAAAESRLTQAAEASAASPAAPGAFARFVERRPLVASLAALGILLTLAVPALDIRLGSADQGNDPAGTPSRVAFDALSAGFGEGVNGQLVVVADLGAPGAFPADASAPPASLAALGAALAADDAVAAVFGPIPNAAGDAATFQVIPTERPQAEGTRDLVERIRADYAPAAEADGLTVHVGGSTASSLDFTDRIAASIPVFFALVVGLSMLVLLIAFRSLWLPLVGALLNALSAAASFGVVVAVFQWGWGHQLIGVGEGGPIEPFAPLILFALLFGLSMDYQVFLVSRMAELWHATGNHRVAVTRGLAEVSRVIIAAASIMVVVFGSFVTSDSRVMKLLGLGLAVAVALDAFVIRVVLMPAIMRVLGRASWWLPRGLDRVLPHLDIDGATHPATATDAEGQLEPVEASEAPVRG